MVGTFEIGSLAYTCHLQEQHVFYAASSISPVFTARFLASPGGIEPPSPSS